MVLHARHEKTSSKMCKTKVIAGGGCGGLGERERERAGEGGDGYLVSLAEFELSHNRRLFNFHLV
jgi:hypothetical protein